MTTPIECIFLKDVDITADGHLTHCCKMNMVIPFTKKDITEDPLWFMNNPVSTRIRDDFKNGIRNSACTECWKAEDAGIDSHRTLHLNQINEATTFSMNVQLPSYCNGTCFYCSPDLSSSIASYRAWIDHAGEEMKPVAATLNVAADMSDIANFVDALELTGPYASVSFTGGEPFLQDNFSERLPLLINAFFKTQQRANYLRGLEIIVSTNCNTKLGYLDNFYNLIDELNKKYNNKIIISINVSIENTEAKAEYCRGIDWDNFINTLNYHFKRAVSVSVKPTFNVLTVTNLPEYIKFLSDYDFKYINWGAVNQTFMRVDVLDTSFCKYVDDAINVANNMHSENKEKLITYMNQLNALIGTNTVEAAKFKQTITALDKIKGTDVLSAFPEMKEWFDSL